MIFAERTNANINAIRRCLHIPRTVKGIVESTGLTEQTVKWILLWADGFQRVHVQGKYDQEFYGNRERINP